MAYKTMRHIMEWLFSILFIIGVVTAALSVTLAGFTPSVWFLMAFLALALIICTEVTQIREFLLKDK